MKKITLCLLLMLFAFSASSQIAISEDFDSGASAWETGGFFFSGTQSCSGQSVRENLYSGNTSGDLTSPNVVGQSNATDLTLTFDYKIVDWSAATNPTGPGWGNFVIQYSTNDGTDWIDIDTIDDANHVASADCATLTYTIPAADLPDGSDFKLQFSATQTGGDYYLYFDNISALQTAVNPPSCDAALTTPADGATDTEINGNISWATASGIPTGYFLTVGTAPGGNDIADNVDVGDVNTYALGQLAYSTTHYVTITPYNDNGTTTDTCIEQSFTTQADPSITIDCTAGAQNFTHCYGNNDDTTWLFTSSDGSPIRLTFNAGGMESCCDDIIIYDGVDDTAPILYQGNNGGDLTGLQFDSTGTSMFLAIDADGSVSCQSNSTCCTTQWDFTAACATCVNPEATYTVVSDCLNAPQFFVDVDITNLGSAGSLTVGDNQGSATQAASATGILTFGPYPNATDVEISVTNDDDSNCVISSTPLTQPFCLDNVVDCTAGPLTLDYCYGNNIDDDPDSETFTFTSSDGSPLNITFNSGFVEACCDELIVFDTDGTELLNDSVGDISGLTFQSTGDTISFVVNSDGSVSCESGSFPEGINYTVSCATCQNPAATYTVVSDCLNAPQFFVDVDITDIGSAGSLTVSDNQGSANQTTSATGILTFGPYPNATDVEITVTNDDDANCVISSTPLTQPFCLDTLIDCTAGPVTIDYCYGNNIDDDPDSETFSFTSSDGTPLNLTFNSGFVESCCDELIVFDTDGTELLNDSVGDISGLTFQSTGDTISFVVNSDGSVSCESGSFPEGINYTVSCATCINPAATYAVIDDCDNGDQFLIDVDVTSIGDATSLTISNNVDANTVAVTAPGVYQIGPFPFLTDVVVTINNDQDANCEINSPSINVAACPPDNDNCDGATVAVVNDGGTCDLVTPGTILEATPSGVANTCTGNPDDDVWFEFTALNEVQLISLLNITGGTTNLDHGVYEGTCGSLTELYCSDQNASVTPSLTVGNTYYIRVFSGGSDGETSSFDLCIREAPTNIICDNAVNFCSEDGTLTTPNIVGIPDPNDIACLATAPNPTWNIIQIGQPGLIEIEISQVDDDGNGLDVDFVLWGPFTSIEDACTNIAFEDCPTCPNNTANPDFYPFGNIVDCSYSFVSVENLTIDNAQEGEIYMLLVTNFSDDPGSISISQTNDGGTGSGTVTAEIEAEITSEEVVFSDTDGDPTTPEEASVCGFDSVTIICDSPFADTYIWYRDGFAIDGETGPTLTVTESDVYQVQAFDNNCDDDAFSQIVSVKLYQDPGTVAPQNITVCDGPSSDGVEDFDLNALTASLGLGPDFAVSYYTNMNDANQAMNPVSTTYNSGGETLIIRIEDVDAANDNFLGCRQLSEVVLVVNALPTANQPDDLIVCDDLDGTVDGSTAFDLESLNDEINTEADTVITYHTSPEDAEAGTGALPNPYTSSGETIHVRVENTLSGCFNTTSFNIVVNIVPLASFDVENPDFDYEVCPNATIPVEIGLIPENFTADQVSIQWYLDDVLITGESGLTLASVLVEGEYRAEITFNDSGCVNSAVSSQVIELESCVIPQGISPNNDGVNDTFDLSSYGVTRLEIFNRNGTRVYAKDNYTNEWVGQTDGGDELPVGTYFYTMVYENGAKSRSAWIYINR